MFGRKGLKPAAPAPAPGEYTDEGVNASLAILSEALGLNLDFDIGYVFSPILWRDPQVADLLTRSGLVAEAQGNKLPLFKDVNTVIRFAKMDANDPVRASLVNAGFAVALYNPVASNRYNESLADMQMKELRDIATSPATDEGKRYAVWSLFDWCLKVMKGEIKLD